MCVGDPYDRPQFCESFLGTLILGYVLAFRTLPYSWQWILSEWRGKWCMEATFGGLQLETSCTEAGGVPREGFGEIGVWGTLRSSQNCESVSGTLLGSRGRSGV